MFFSEERNIRDYHECCCNQAELGASGIAEEWEFLPILFFVSASNANTDNKQKGAGESILTGISFSQKNSKLVEMKSYGG